MANEQQRAVLFADISGSTRLYEAVGDLRAREIVANCIGLMISACEGQGGTLIKTIGDEVMVSFEEARAAARSAIRMQEGISGTLVVEGRPIQIRVGFHQGSVLLDAGDIFGDTVNLAARIAAQAKAGQVLTTGATVRILGPEWACMVRRIDCAPVKGKREEVEIFELLWQRDDLTRMAGCGPGPRLTRPGARLRLAYRDLSIEICAERPSLTIGRSEQNDLVVVQSLASRQHARINYHKGHFMLTDQSTNGTYLIDEDGEETFVHRDILSLRGGCLIGLGEAPEANSADSLRAQLID